MAQAVGKKEVTITSLIVLVIVVLVALWIVRGLRR